MLWGSRVVVSTGFDTRQVYTPVFGLPVRAQWAYRLIRTLLCQPYLRDGGVTYMLHDVVVEYIHGSISNQISLLRCQLYAM